MSRQQSIRNCRTVPAARADTDQQSGKGLSKNRENGGENSGLQQEHPQQQTLPPAVSTPVIQSCSGRTGKAKGSRLRDFLIHRL